MEGKTKKLNTQSSIDDELSRKYHINRVSNKISKITGIIARANHYVSLKTLLTLYIRHYDISILIVL